MNQTNAKRIYDNKIKRIHIKDDLYPALLRNINKPPEILFCLGDLSLLNQHSIAIVGSRKATAYGKWAATQMAKKLTDYELVVVSGMAAGIDSYAHKGALDNNGKTIAVLGCGLDICYPSSNRKLMDCIAKDGLLVSEYEPGTPPMAYQFPMRNRIISGLSLASVIVEAGIKSGSLITAECSAEQGRNIYAIPGNINNIYSIGTNKLIQDGATPIVVFDDVIDDLGITRNPIDLEENIIMGRDEKDVYNIIRSGGEVSYDYIYLKTGKTPSEVNPIVTILEMKGLVQTALGKVFIAK